MIVLLQPQKESRLPNIVRRQLSEGCQCRDGLPGPRGPEGRKGEQGLPGQKGDLGETGPRGPVGMWTNKISFVVYNSVNATCMYTKGSSFYQVKCFYGRWPGLSRNERESRRKRQSRLAQISYNVKLKLCIHYIGDQGFPGSRGVMGYKGSKGKVFNISGQ